MKQEDLQQIKQVVDKSINETVVKTIKPSFDGVYERLDKVEGKVDNLEVKVNNIETKVDNLEGNINQLPDKDYLDKKLFDLKGDTNEKLIKHERKHNLLNKIQKDKGILNQENIEQLKQFDMFPNLQP